MTEFFGKKNLVLIGMPGAGKSTVGVILAKRTSRAFVDTDLLIQTTHSRSLQEIIDEFGHQRLRDIEEEVLLTLDVESHVVATGGSVVYSDVAMKHLKRNGLLVFLDVELDELERRVGDYRNRGIAKRENQSFEDLFEERGCLYRKYADHTISSKGLSAEMIGEQIVQLDSK